MKNLEKEHNQLKVQFNDNKALVEKRFDGTLDRIDLVKKALESRIDAFKHVENTVAKCQQ